MSKQSVACILQNKFARQKLAVLTLAFAMPATLCSADPKTGGAVGRYQDGRAYRVDAQGYQLTDQIAELEVTVREQEKQISACEERLEKSEKGLPQPKRSGSSESSSASSYSAPEVSAASCAGFTTPLELRVNDLQGQLGGRTIAACNYSAQTGPLQAQIAQLQNQLAHAPKDETVQKMSQQSMALKSSLDGERSSLNEQVKNLELEHQKTVSLQSELSQTKAQLAQKESELSKHGVREQELLANIDKLSSELSNAGRQSSNAGRGMLNSNSDTAGIRPERRELSRTEPMGSTEVSGESKKRIQTELGTVQRLIVERKDLFDSVRTARKGVTVGIQPLETSKRVTLDQLRTMAMNPGSDEQAGQILAGIGQIKAILQSDIQVLDRLLKHL